MACKVKDAIEEMANLAKLPGMAKYKAELEDILKEVESIRTAKPEMEQYIDEAAVNTTEYQKESIYEIGYRDSIEEGLKVLKDKNVDTEEAISKSKALSRIHDFIQQTEKTLKEMYPNIKLKKVKNLEDDKGIAILGKAFGNVITVDIENIRPDTIPHEYAHIYINTLDELDFNKFGEVTVYNTLDKIMKIHNLDRNEAKEFLAKRIGENYVNKNIPKSLKEERLIKKIWQFIVNTFKGLVSKDVRLKNALLKDVRTISKEFKAGKHADKVNSKAAAKFVTEEMVKSYKDEANVEIDSAKSAFFTSNELHKYGTLEDYRNYLDTIFPDSEVKDILAHDTGYGGSMFSGETVNTKFEDSWMYDTDVEITGKGNNYGLVSGEGFYMYKPNSKNEKWDQYAATTGYMKVNIKKLLDNSSEEFKNIKGNTYYEKMANLTDTELQSNPDEWFMLDNPPEKVTINSIVNEKTGYDGYINKVRKDLIEVVAWKNEQVHILGSKKDVEGFKKYIKDNGKKGLGLSENNTALLPVDAPKNMDKKIPEGLVPKEEYHITVLGFPQGKLLSKAFAKKDAEIGIKGYSRHYVQSALEKANKEYKLTDTYHEIARDREAWVDWKDQSKGKKTIHEESLIQLVEAPGLQKVVEDINKELGIDLPIPIPHITLATSKGSLGIGIPDQKALDNLINKKTSIPQIYKTYEFGETYHNANKAANKYVADMAGLAYANSERWLTPKIQEFHDNQMRTNKVYSKMYNTIKDGSNNIELINKIAHSLFLTGDTSRIKIAKLTKMVEDSNRPAMEILTTEMPEWDKKVSAAIKGEKEQQLLTEIYGLSGYGALSDYYIDGKSLLQLLNGDAKPAELMNKLNLTKEEKTIVTQLHDRLVNHKVQSNGIVNAGHNNKLAAAVVLQALMENNNAGYKLHQKVKTRHKEIHDKLVEMAVNAYTINNMVNKGIGSMDIGDRSEFMYTDYEGHGLLDIYSNSHEFKVVTEEELNRKEYHGKYNPWEVMETDNKNPGFRIVFRKSQEVYEQGLAVNMDRIQNGLYIDKAIVLEGLKNDSNWLVKNNVQKYTSVDGKERYRVVLSKKQAIQAEGMNNVVQSLYRSVVHNTQLIEQQTMRKMVKAELTEDGSTHQKLRLLERRIQYNKRTDRKNRKEVKPYLKTDISNEELKKKYPAIAAEYQIATNISQYEGLNKDLRYVRKGMVDIMVGFRSGTIIHDSMPWLQDIERRYKQLVALKKLKMVVASPTKLMSDIMSNAAILMALDVDPQEGGKDMKEAFDYWNETSTMEAEIVRLKMELISAEASGDKDRITKAKAKKDAMDKKMQKHPFYDAYKYGFVQSMATSMMIKEFDTISGLQHTIDEVVKKVTTDEKHKPNAIHNAIVKWMHWGYSIEDIARYAGNASKLKGTMFGDELIEMGNRLADHKKVGEENVAGYITEIIAGPQSELVRQGSRVMQMGDLASRWALYKHTIGEELEKVLGRTVSRQEVNDVVRGNRLGLTHEQIKAVKETSAMRALDTFVDYRLNLPSTLKRGSDLGILWFPSYWLRNTVVIPQMIAAKPLNSMVAIALSGVTGMSTVYESHPLWKIVSDNKSIIHPGMDVTTADTFIPFVP